VLDGVIAVTATSLYKKAVVPLWINSRIMPAVVVPCAVITTCPIREPFAPAVSTVPIVPVPSRLAFAVEIVTTPRFAIFVKTGEVFAANR
jgi:hypothetical protein